ncbi:hypothetical protein CAC42_1921 [Sphaceloma murrayae]|uniref:Cytochrome P450 n=1 Tax=Sphaceloma murrayae TaxID=2082308 RepID=A0A2K1QVU9_9PEZI|nr:hypothetical protein CAC42_1921 [Sphaceloma murrayae]
MAALQQALAMVPHELFTIFAFSAVFLVVAFLSATLPRSLPSKAPPLVSGCFPVVGAVKFFSARAEFFKEKALESKSGIYTFFVGSYPVVGLSGPHGRSTFYDAKQLSLFEGYAGLLTATPGINSVENGSKFDSWFARKISRLMKRDHLVKSLDHLVTDTEAALSQIARANGQSQGVFDPFEHMNRIVYQLTLRTVGVHELAEAAELLEKSRRLVEKIDDNNSTAKIVLPWLPAPKHISRLYNSVKFFLLINGIVRQRKKEQRRFDDALQILIDEDTSIARIVMFVINALLAALLNSGMNAAWVLCHLAVNPYWLDKVRAEVNAALTKHRSNPEQRAVDILRTLTIEDWETEFITTNMCLHESIRLQTVGAAFRKNVSGRPVEIGNTGYSIPKDGYAAFHIDDIHMDPQIYSQPTKFDPSRYLPDRAEDKKVPFAYE